VPTQLTFEAGVQDAQEYGSNDVWMVSRVFFWILREGAPPGDFWADLRSLAGSKFDRIKIPPPANYTGPMAYVDLRQPVGEDFDRAPIEVGALIGSPRRCKADSTIKRRLLQPHERVRDDAASRRRRPQWRNATQ
jgi:hypothetical protein